MGFLLEIYFLIFQKVHFAKNSKFVYNNSYIEFYFKWSSVEKFKPLKFIFKFIMRNYYKMKRDSK